MFPFFSFVSGSYRLCAINFKSAVQSLTPLLVQFRPRKSNVALRAQVIDSRPRRQLLILSSSILQLMTVAPTNAVPTKFLSLNEPLQYPFNSSISGSREEVTPNITQHVSDSNLTNVTLLSMQTTRGSNLSLAVESSMNNNNLYNSNASTIVTIKIPRTDSNDPAIMCEGETVVNCTIIQQIFKF
jgi:hypothetical protein